jgi:hypothetical protein
MSIAAAAPPPGRPSGRYTGSTMSTHPGEPGSTGPTDRLKSNVQITLACRSVRPPRRGRDIVPPRRRSHFSAKSASPREPLSRRTRRAGTRALEGFTQFQRRNPKLFGNTSCYSLAQATFASLDATDGRCAEPYCTPEQGLRESANDAPIPRIAILRFDIDHVFDSAVQMFENSGQNVDLRSSFVVLPSTNCRFGNPGEPTEVAPRQLLVLPGLFEACGVEPAHHAPGHGAGSLAVAMVDIAGHDACRPLQLAHRMVGLVEHIGYTRTSENGRRLQQRSHLAADCPR